MPRLAINYNQLSIIMKKNLLLFAAITCCSLSMNAQLQFNRDGAGLGFNGHDTIKVNGFATGQLRCYMDFNTKINYGAYTKDSNGKGIFCRVFNDLGSSADVAVKKIVNWGATANVYRYPNVQAFLDSVSPQKTLPWSTANKFWMPQGMLVDVNDTDQVFALYPGIWKGQNFGFQIKRDSPLTTDISFDMLTVDNGNTSKALAYKMILMLDKETVGSQTSDRALLDTISSENNTLVNTYVVDSVYASKIDEASLNRKVTINVATACGLTIADLNKHSKIYVMLYAPNSSRAISVGTYDPVVAIDNIQCDYTLTTWSSPTGATSGARLTDSISSQVNTVNSYTLKLADANRAAKITIKGSSNGGNTRIYINPTDALMSKDADGNYTIPVSYTFIDATETAPASLEIAAPTSGSVSDDMELTINVKPTTVDKTYSETFDISNGSEFFYTLKVTGTDATAIKTQSISKAQIVASNGKISVLNNSNDVIITNLSGAIVTKTSATKAASGIYVDTGTYIVTVGSTSSKVLVK
jgi:hypothetical protein